MGKHRTIDETKEFIATSLTHKVIESNNDSFTARSLSSVLNNNANRNNRKTEKIVLSNLPNAFGSYNATVHTSKSCPTLRADQAKFLHLQREREAEIEAKKKDSEKRLLQKEYRSKMESSNSGKYFDVFAKMVQLDDEELMNIGRISINNEKSIEYVNDLKISFLNREAMKRNPFQHQGHRRYSSFSRGKHDLALKKICSDGELISLYWREGY